MTNVPYNIQNEASCCFSPEKAIKKR